MRDNTPMDPLAESLTDAIDRSQKRLLVLTPSFFENQWCSFCLHMTLPRGLQNLVMLELLPTSGNESCSPRLLERLKASVTTLTMPIYPEELTAFWQSVHQAVDVNMGTANHCI